MPMRNVDLTDHFDHFIEELIAAGRYRDASEAMRAGLRLLEREAIEEEAKLATLRSLATEAFIAIDRGEGTVLEGEQELRDFLGAVGRRSVGRRNSG